ncbi:MAG: GNAT family N-acetyltransferase [Acidimicrobiales bacterium]
MESQTEHGEAFTPIKTERLLLRRPTMADLDALVTRRSEPQVAEYQSWSAPFPRSEAETLLAGAFEMPGPQNEEWWMATVAGLVGGEVPSEIQDQVLGDLAVRLSEEGNVAEIGYTFSSRYWGRGYATEAVEAMVAHLFQSIGVGRVAASLDVENVASAQVLERTGFLYEGRTRHSYWPAHSELTESEPSDDLLYGMTKADWVAWRERPSNRPAEVRLIDITAENQRAVSELQTHKSQERFVATVANSYGNALFPAVIDGVALTPTPQAIEADGVLVGFIMTIGPTPRFPQPHLWRLLIDRVHQRRGIGARAIECLVEQLRAEGQQSLSVSWSEGRGSPGAFYRGLGFEPTGQGLAGEIEAKRSLAL